MSMVPSSFLFIYFLIFITFFLIFPLALLIRWSSFREPQHSPELPVHTNPLSSHLRPALHGCTAVDLRQGDRAPALAGAWLALQLPRSSAASTCAAAIHRVPAGTWTRRRRRSSTSPAPEPPAAGL
jgi:hypothetical protein